MKSILKRQALAAISGLPLTSNCYKEAIAILKMRFGNKQLLNNTHIEKLLAIPKEKSINDVKNLREAYDAIEIHSRNLKILDVNTTEYGPVLISIVMSKLLGEIKLVISRAMSDKEKWQADGLLTILRKELESREMCGIMTSMESEEKHRSKRFESRNYTASALLTETNPE